MNGVPELLEFQVGIQGDFDTAVAGAYRLMGVESGNIQPGQEAEIAKDIRKSIAPRPIGQVTKQWGLGSVALQLCYDEEMALFLDAMLATATPSGAGPYTRDWDGALAASPALSPLTVIKGGADGVYKLTGAVVNGLTLTGETGKRLMANVDLLAKSFSTASLAGLSDRVINPIMGHHMSALYIDNAGGTIGTTAFTPLTYSFELALKPGRQGKQGLGEVGISNWQEGDWTGTLKLAAELDATSKAIYDAAIAASDPVGKLVRMVFTDGADVFQWDFAGKILQPPAPFEEFERSLVFNFVLEGSYDTGMANWLAFNLINDVATL